MCLSSSRTQAFPQGQHYFSCSLEDLPSSFQQPSSIPPSRHLPSPLHKQRQPTPASFFAPSWLGCTTCIVIWGRGLPLGASYLSHNTVSPLQPRLTNPLELGSHSSCLINVAKLTEKSFVGNSSGAHDEKHSSCPP